MFPCLLALFTMSPQLASFPAGSHAAPSPARCLRLGRMGYAEALALQDEIQTTRRANQGAGEDTLLLLEHPAVLTLGRAATRENILASAHQLDALGVDCFETDRGGEVTYHGPGQVVGYPLWHLKPGRQDVRKYVRSLEEVLIRSVADFGVAATRMPQWPGVWVAQSKLGGTRKIAALGVHLSRWYTRHGFALNVTTDLSHFELIIPCGIREASVTSIAAELNRTVDMAAVETSIVTHFADVFECRFL
jgi:lipoyl(octanoyl) transferase